MKKMVFAVCVLLSACGPQVPDMGKVERTRPVESEKASALAPDVDPDRFTVSRQMTFADKLAYNGYRAVYVLKDNKTGTEYVGVSGIGIAELGSHRSGKSDVADER